MIQSIKWNGETITAPGVYSDMPLADYHRGDICDGPSISSSGLRKIWHPGPAYYWSTSPLNPDRSDEDDDKEAYVVGRAAHHLICGQAFFASEFIIRPDEVDGAAWQGNRKACKAWMAAAKRAGKSVLTPAQVETVKGMAISLGRNSLVQGGILNGLIERSLFWRDAETGVWLKARPDAMPSDSGDFADLKTTQSVLYVDLQKTLDDFGHPQQGALVIEGARALGVEASTFSDVFVEKKRPHCVRVATLFDEDLALGADQNRVALRTFADCLANGHWPGPGDDRADAETIKLSERARERIKERLKFQLREAA
jgi:hypothetical protein